MHELRCATRPEAVGVGAGVGVSDKATSEELGSGRRYAGARALRQQSDSAVQLVAVAQPRTRRLCTPASLRRSVVDWPIVVLRV